MVQRRVRHPGRCPPIRSRAAVALPVPAIRRRWDPGRSPRDRPAPHRRSKLGAAETEDVTDRPGERPTALVVADGETIPETMGQFFATGRFAGVIVMNKTIRDEFAWFLAMQDLAAGEVVTEAAHPEALADVADPPIAWPSASSPRAEREPEPGQSDDPIVHGVRTDRFARCRPGGAGPAGMRGGEGQPSVAADTGADRARGVRRPPTATSSIEESAFPEPVGGPFRRLATSGMLRHCPIPPTRRVGFPAVSSGGRA